MNLYRVAVFGLFFIIASCSSLPYADDTAFAVSAQANSPEFPVYVNGALCKDMDGNPGMCSKRITSATSLALHIDAQAYPYDFTIACTNPITVPGQTVPQGQALDLSVSPQQMSGLLTYICRGEVFPQDRPQPLSALFEVRVDVVDANYEPREAMTTNQDSSGGFYLVLGAYARNSWVCDQGVCRTYSEQTTVPISAPGNVQAYSESYSMRENYFQWSGPIP